MVEQQMLHESTLIGSVQDVNGPSVSIQLSDNLLSGLTFINGHGYRIGQVGSFVRLPIGFVELYGIVSQVGASSVPEALRLNQPYGNRWLTVQLIGEGYKNGAFKRGISQYPTVGDQVHLVSEYDLRKIYGQPDLGYFVPVGTISGADSILALVDVNKLVTRHSAVVGTTGSGKSTTVASLLHALSNSKYPSARILLFDIHGEYGKAFKDNANTFRIGTKEKKNEKTLQIPFWALNFQELSEICFGRELEERVQHFLMEKILERKKESLRNFPKKGADTELLDVDSPIPYCLSKLWYDLYGLCFSTYYSQNGADKNDQKTWAYAETLSGVKQVGNFEKGIPPRFRPIDTSSGAVKINYTSLLGSMTGIGSHLEALGSKLRLPRYDFLFRPGKFSVAENGSTQEDLDALIKSWISSDQKITIMDLSGVPSEILNTVIGAICRILYEALFWGRNLSQGGRLRPLLMVMEEAHNYLNDSSFAALSVQKIVKEGRKYGVGTMIVSQRPSEINSTILSQCGTFFSLRLSNEKDKSHVAGVISDNLQGLTSMLPTLKTGEAIILGEAVKLPMRTIVSPPSKDRRPDSHDPIVFDPDKPEDSINPGGWGIAMEPNPNLQMLVECWRKQSSFIERAEEIIKENNDGNVSC